MPVRAYSMANEFLAGVFGPDRSATARSSHVVRLWSTLGTVEADWPGYTPPEWSADDWLAPDAGVVYSDGLVDFGAPTGAGSVAVKFWSLHDVTDDELLYSGPLSEALSVVESEASVLVRLSVPLLVTA